ncbi:diaminopimelate epimerase [Flavobacterium sp. ASW18X]|nr:diaminopimelate epimerase [Flavobacterium sp. ASW18X]
MNTGLQLEFYKYQGTGNDFVMVDNRALSFPKENTELVAFLCDRRFGIGADGLILLENDNVSDFKMVYYNSDGNPSTMCGNGGRCIVAFARDLGIIQGETTFNAVDGLHHATLVKDVVSLQMIDVTLVEQRDKYYFVNTGSPHHVQLVKDLPKLKVKEEGAKLRYGIYGEKGSNINFVEAIDAETYAVRTYERGVEDETLSCGTGVTAVALSMYAAKKTDVKRIQIKAMGGDLEVSFEHQEDGSFTKVRLKGSAKQVFSGVIKC